MYAHQVVEDLKGYGDFIGVSKTVTYQNYIVDLVKSAQCFHMGELTDLLLSSSSIFGKEVFICKEDADLRLPYETCWFDYSVDRKRMYNAFGDTDNRPTVESSKRGVLCVEAGAGHIFLKLFSYFDDIKKWLPSLLLWDIRLGKEALYRSEEEFAVRFAELLNTGKEDMIKRCVEDDTDEMGVICYFFRLLCCKNIVLKNHFPPIKLNDKREKKGKQPLFKYHTLKVKLPGKQTGGGGVTESEGSTRIHLCRGHFKTYTKEKPLFGRFTGRYWWQPSVRGNKDQGVLMKDYNVKVT